MEVNYSQKLYNEACQLLVGGVNSPVRAFKSVGGTPLFIQRAKGSHIWDVDGNEHIDYVGSWGPAILGHAPDIVLRAIHETMKDGLSFGAPTPKEIELAKLVKKAFPSIDRIRFVNSGTEATMSAIRLARGFTKKSKIVKFDGCYHGHADHLLVRSGSGAATLGVPDSAGVPVEFTSQTLVAQFNDLDSVKKLFREHKNKIACVIVEPVVGNMGCIPPAEGFLTGLRELTQNENALLIFDEVITGFRVAFGGAQELYGMKPDLTCLGKIIGGGLPVGAFGGRRDIMEYLAPEGPVYQAGTLSGNPLAMAAGIAVLTELSKPGVYARLREKGEFLAQGVNGVSLRCGHPIQVNQVGSMFSFFFSHDPVVNAEGARKVDSNKFKQFFHSALESGIYLPPSPFETSFISLAHTEEDIDRTLSVFEMAFNHLAE